jgi:hypothetical protein
MAEAQKDANAGEAAEGDAKRSGGRVSWLLGWLLIPGFVAGAIVLAGVVVGAHYPDLWFTRLVQWFVG